MDSASTADFTEQLSELEIAALAASYGSLPAARGLLQRAGLPVIDLPMGDGRQSARLYWGTVAEELCNGLQQGGRVALLAVARRENPENSAFGGRQVARRLPGWRPAAAILTAVAVAVTLACLPIWTDDVPTIPAAQRSPETGQSVTKPVLPASEGSPEISASAALACASAPGFGIPAYTRSIRNAYDLAGGQATLGCATNNVVAVGGGAQQQFRTPSGRDAAIVAPDPAHAFALLPDDLRCLTDVLDGYTITVQRGVSGQARGGGERRPGHPPSRRGAARRERHDSCAERCGLRVGYPAVLARLRGRFRRSDEPVGLPDVKRAGLR